ncbi:TadE/TadG family type IV pilus assembly protein [Burkholderia sp. FL-7-2-10-S1-D7]|uniref:TadE/TadG family type IV pilus assembly protein n=1 Tax=Burkholderia sp. FL-7-2-10-S1-D7 TaxID=1637866 RepID=UPI0009E97077|nr:TadE/TadG family type IV pilus assembly protein [Burkholderia sp. FL-7-2-10-S1-D7]
MKSQKGSAAIEMAVTMPFIIMILLGMAQFGWLLANFIAVSNAASSAVRTFASQRGTTTPYTTTLAQAKAAASFLNQGGITINTTVNGIACSDDAGCAADLAPASSAAVNVPVKVSVNYSGFHPVVPGNYLNLNSMMPSILIATFSARVQ